MGIYFPLLYFLLIMLIAGCQKDTAPPPIIITEDDAADMVGSAFSSIIHGLTWQLTFGAMIADSGDIPLSQRSISAPIETTITRQGTLGGYSYHFTTRYRYEFSPLNDSLYFFYWNRGAYNTPRVSADDSAWVDLKITKFLGRDSCTVNGIYNRQGVHVMKLRDKRQFTSTIYATLVNVIVDSRIPRKVVYGVINLQVEGESSDGTKFSYIGVLSIYGDSIASLILEDQTYEIDLDTGNATWVEDDGDDDGGM